MAFTVFPLTTPAAALAFMALMALPFTTFVALAFVAFVALP